MTDRHGGVSQAPWDSMNVGDHVGDSLQNTRVNRQLLRDVIGTRPVFLNQVHGVQSVLLDTSSEDGTQADACISVASGVACTIMVADCLPVLMCDVSGRWVAAAHAGWRGLAGDMGHGVLEALLAASPICKTKPEDILVWLGPCIGPQAFEVGAEVRAVFCEANPASEACFVPSGSAKGKYLCDLAGLARLRLQALGTAQQHRLIPMMTLGHCPLEEAVLDRQQRQRADQGALLGTRSVGANACHAGQPLNGLVLEQLFGREADTRLARAADHLNGDDRVTAEGKEVVKSADRLHLQSQELSPESDNGLFQFRCGCYKFSSCQDTFAWFW